MKTLLLLVSACMYWLCIPAHAAVVLQGKIANATADSISVTFSSSRLAFNPVVYSASLKSGVFKIAIPSLPADWQTAELHLGQHVADLVLMSGDSLFLSADENRFDSSLHFSGRGEAAANFVAYHTVLRGRMNQYSIRLRNHITDNPDDYIAALNKELADETQLLKSNYPTSGDLFSKNWVAFFQYYNYFFLQQYPYMHQAYKLQRFTDTIDADYWKPANTVPEQFNDELLQVPSYLLYLSGLYESRLRAAGLGFPSSDTTAVKVLSDSVLQLAYDRMSNHSGAYFVAQYLYARCRQQDTATTHAQFRRYVQHWPSSEYTSTLQQQILIADRLATGMPAPDMQVETTDGKKMMLSDLKGKVVYITFWASWCKQCVGEMRLLEHKVKNIFKDKDVVFVQVALDKRRFDAEKVIRQLFISGYHTFATGEWYSPEVSAYGVQGLPAYYLIDKEGRFAAVPAPAPQQTVPLIVAISKLL